MTTAAFIRTAFACISLLAATACTSTVSRGVGDDGTAQELVFPDIQASATLPEGSFPNADDLRAVQPGLSKDQIAALLGRPHFREGLADVREWDYVLNFRDAGGVATCQFKVLFDKEHLARSLYWKPAACPAAQGARR